MWFLMIQGRFPEGRKLSSILENKTVYNKMDLRIEGEINLDMSRNKRKGDKCRFCGVPYSCDLEMYKDEGDTFKHVYACIFPAR